MSTRKHPGITRQEPSRRFPSGGWTVRYRDSENRTLRRTLDTRQAALDFQAQVRTDKNRGEFINPRRAATPFRNVAEDWFGSLQLKPKTRAGYRQILDAHLIPAFGERAVARIKAPEIERFLAGTGVEPGTQRNILRVLSSVMRSAIKGEMIRANPCGMVTPPKINRREMLFLTPEQVRAVADAITPEYRTLVLTAAYTGLRAGELGALRVANLDLLRNRLHVKGSVADVGGQLHFGPTKTGKSREVALPSFLVELLAKQAAGKGANDLVFTGANGAPLRHGNYYQRHFKPAVRAALPEKLHGLRFHDLRHTAAAILIRQGVHPKAIADRLGHSSIAITMDRYGHLYDDHEDAIAADLDNVYEGAGSISVGEVRPIEEASRG